MCRSRTGMTCAACGHENPNANRFGGGPGVRARVVELRGLLLASRHAIEATRRLSAEMGSTVQVDWMAKVGAPG